VSFNIVVYDVKIYIYTSFAVNNSP